MCLTNRIGQQQGVALYSVPRTSDHYGGSVTSSLHATHNEGNVTTSDDKYQWG